MNGKKAKMIRRYAQAQGFRESKCKKAWLQSDPDIRKIMTMEALSIISVKLDK